MKRMLWAVVLAGMAATCACAKTVGIWKDRKSGYGDGMPATLREAGWDVVILEGKDLAEGTKLAELDVVMLTGGHNVYNFPGFEASRSRIAGRRLPG